MEIFKRKKNEETSAKPKKAAAVKDVKPAAEKKETAKKEDVKKGDGQITAYKILVQPLVTEKASVLSADNKYVFKVAVSANKIEVAQAINEIYNVMPIKINMVKMIGKGVTHGRTRGKRKNWKKAIITLPAGKTINVYEGV